MRLIAPLLLSVTLALGCGVKRKQTAKQSDPAADKQENEGNSLSPLGNLDMLGSMLSSSLGKPGPYDELRESEGYTDGQAYLPVLELSGSIVELQGFDLFGGAGGTELRALLDKLDEVAGDDKATGLLLRLSDLSLSMATAEELRAALVQFKGDGARKVSCHAEAVSNITYYIMSVCDTIALAPTGELAITGIAGMPIHLKGMLDKLGIEADFLTMGAYKGAAEPITRDAPSKEMLETLNALMDQMFATMVNGIAKGRNLTPEATKGLIDTAMFQPEAAIAAKLVDQVAIFESFRAQQAGDGAFKHIKVGKDKSAPDMQSLMQFVGMMPRTQPTEPHVALVYAVGNIIDGKGEGIIGARQEIASRTLSAAIRAVTRDNKVKAIVLRIDSGGGSALASELILTALNEAKAVKPVIVSMAGVAGSGGYYIACNANKVFALDNTITGSIGVLGGKLVMRKAFDNIGVKAYPQGRGKRALISSMVDRWTADERTAISGYMESVYKTFVTHVSNGRGKTYDEVHTVAQGRVWSGAAAKQHGLVDEIGGLRAALSTARKMGGVAEGVELAVYPPEPTLSDILGSFGQVQTPLGLGGSLDARAAAMLDEAAEILGIKAARVIADSLRTLAMMRESHVLTATFLPVVFD